MRDKKDKAASAYLMQMMEEVDASLPASHPPNPFPALHLLSLPHSPQPNLTSLRRLWQVEQEKVALGPVEDAKMQVQALFLPAEPPSTPPLSLFCACCIRRGFSGISQGSIQFDTSFLQVLEFSWLQLYTHHRMHGGTCRQQARCA